MDVEYFWSHSIWYLLLLLISIVLLGYVVFKSQDRKRDLGFFVAILGLSFLLETIIYIFLRAYEYYPHIIPHSPKNDGVIGNIISQFLLSTIALFICVFQIPFRGVVLAGGIIYLIEILFLALGIYQTFWYRPWITFFILAAGLEIIKKWYEFVKRRKSRLLQNVTGILAVLALYLPTTNWIGILSGYFDIKEDILIDPYISHAVVAIPKYCTQVIMIYFLNLRKAGWIWHAAAVTVIFSVDAILYYIDLVHIKEGWLLIYSAISVLTTYLYVKLVKTLLHIY